MCLQELDPPSFSVYTEFFTHVESMCHYIQADLWQRSTKATIHALSKNAATAAHTLMKTHALQETLLNQQQDQLDGYETLQREHVKLEHGLARTSESIDAKVPNFLQEKWCCVGFHRV